LVLLTLAHSDFHHHHVDQLALAAAPPLRLGCVDLLAWSSGRPFSWRTGAVRTGPARAGGEATAPGQARLPERYRFDRGADLSPVDLALGWGPMSDQAVLDRIDISQGGRFYYWHVKEIFPVPRREIEVHSANMHMIPATEEIERRLVHLRPGQVVALTGYLVDVRGPDGWRWHSSLTREDTGAGACELVWVDKLDAR
jgi:hypothetical protein